MLAFNFEDGKQVQIDREAVEEKLLLSIFERFDQAREKDAGLYNILKQAVNMVMMFGKADIKIPKGENTLEYLVAHYISLGLDALEKEPLQVIGKVVDAADGKEEKGE